MPFRLVKRREKSLSSQSFKLQRVIIIREQFAASQFSETEQLGTENTLKGQENLNFIIEFPQHSSF